MRPGPFVLIPLAVGLALLADVPAQRRPLLGTVVDGQGEPLAQATVHGFFLPRDAPSLAAADHVEATTDERGRFRLAVHPCTPYQLWAIGPTGEHGARLASEFTPASAGRLARLVAAHEQAPGQARIEGFEAWPDAAPLRLRLPLGVLDRDADEGSRGACTVPVDEAGCAQLPALPAAYVPYELLDGTGNLLYGGRLRQNKETAKVRLSPPRQVPMRVVDGNGAPLAGAIVRQRFSFGHVGGDTHGPSRPTPNVWRTLGETDADGRLVAVIANRNDPFEYTGYQSLFFLAQLPGRTSSHSGFYQNPYVDGRQVDREGVTELRFTLRERKPFVGQLRRGGDGGIAGQTVTVHFGIKVENKDGNGWLHESLLCSAETDAEGRFVIAEAPHHFFEADVLLGGGIRSELVPEEMLRMTPIEAVALHELPEDANAELRLAAGTMPKIQLQLLNETGGPAGGAEVLLVSLATGDPDCDRYTPSATTDSAGRLLMLAQPGKWLLFARDAGGMAHQTLELDGDRKLELRLQPMPAMRGKVVDGAGEPIAGADLDCHSATWHGNADRDPGLEAIANNLNWQWIGSTKSDAEGAFACYFLDLSGMTYEARFRHEGKQSKDLRVVPDEEPVTIVIE